MRTYGACACFICLPNTRLFERTVDIVQSLPPNGPIQTSYEEKLVLYGYVSQPFRENLKSCADNAPSPFYFTFFSPQTL